MTLYGVFRNDATVPIAICLKLWTASWLCTALRRSEGPPTYYHEELVEYAEPQKGALIG